MGNFPLIEKNLYKCIYSTEMCSKWFMQIFPSMVVQQFFAEHSIKHL